MHTTSCSHLRRTLAATLDQVAANHGPVLITRGRKPVAVLVSLGRSGAFDETDYLLASPRNRKRLLEAVGRFDARDAVERQGEPDRRGP